MPSCPSPSTAHPGGLSRRLSHAAGRRADDLRHRRGFRPRWRQPLLFLERLLRGLLEQRLLQLGSVHSLAPACRRLQQLPLDRLGLGRARRADHGHRRPLRPRHAPGQPLQSRHHPLLPLLGYRLSGPGAHLSRWWPAIPRARPSPSPGRPAPARWALPPVMTPAAASPGRRPPVPAPARPDHLPSPSPTPSTSPPSWSFTVTGLPICSLGHWDLDGPRCSIGIAGAISRYCCPPARSLSLGAATDSIRRSCTTRARTPGARRATWSKAATASRGRGCSTARCSSSGGTGSVDRPLASAELYDPVSGTWSSPAPWPGVAASHTATLLADGKVLVAGGERHPVDGGAVRPGHGHLEHYRLATRHH